MWTGNVSPVIRQKAKGTRPKRNAERRAARRHVLPGFPLPPRAFTLDEIRAYFSGDWITCLLCGKSYRRISANHLHGIHAVSEDEYRERYGLPWGRGLTSAASHDNYSAATNLRIAAGEMPQLGGQHQHMVIGARRRPRQPFRREVCLENIAFAPLQPANAYEPRAKIAEFLDRVARGCTPRQIYADTDMPGASWFHVHMTPEQKAELRQIIWKQSYAFQAKAQHGFSPAFYGEVRQLRGRGLSDKSIAAILGLTAMTIHRQRTKHGIA